MNVIIVNDYAYINGGASQIALHTAKNLAYAGCDVYLFSAVGPVDESLKNIKRLNVICLHQSDILSNPSRLQAIVQGLWNKKASDAMYALLNSIKNNETIVHIHTLSKAISSSIIPIIKKFDIPILYHLHDYGIACPNLGFYDYQKNKICIYKALGRDCLFCDCDRRSYPQKIWRVLRQMTQKYIGKMPRNIDGFICISNFSYNILSKYLLDKPVEFLPNNVDVEDIGRVEAEDNKYYVYIGRLSQEKGSILLAEAANCLDVPSIFIGDGEDRENIESHAKNAIFTGWLSHEEMLPWLKMARALVFPSLWYETQGLTAIEALARGIPVIVANNCAARDAVQNNVSGRFFESGDVESLKKVMREFKDKEKVKKYSMNAYNDYRKKDNSDATYIKNLQEIYHKYLQEKNRK